ncbi:MAG: hypothetical protein J1E16_04265 [Muribaculaceae bacterium]|nr:hypothetical protein [Muribaculaceae bacterium]
MEKKFKLTAEEVEIAKKGLQCYCRDLTSLIDYAETIGEDDQPDKDRLLVTDNLLARIKQWQSENQ